MKNNSVSTCAGALTLLAALMASGCASAPIVAPVAPTTSFEQKMAWMLQLEDRRILLILVRPAPAAPPPVVQRGRARPAPPPPPVVTPDLIALVGDAEPRVRRRAAMAIGRVGLSEGIKPLTATLADTDLEVREMAAFALGSSATSPPRRRSSRRWRTRPRSSAAGPPRRSALPCKAPLGVYVDGTHPSQSPS